MASNVVNHVQAVRLLYKTILKLHRGLPAELQLIGDNYVKDEFRRHKKCKPEEAQLFMSEWSSYAFTIAKQIMETSKNKSHVFGSALDEEALNNLNDNQIRQLYELMVAAKEKPQDVIDEVIQKNKG